MTKKTLKGFIYTSVGLVLTFQMIAIIGAYVNRGFDLSQLDVYRTFLIVFSIIVFIQELFVLYLVRKGIIRTYSDIDKE
jgi:hypothetical protein